MQDQQAFSSRYVEPANGSNTVMATAAQQLYDLCQALYRAHPIEFSLTPDQRTRLGHHLETAYPTLMQLLGDNFHSVVLRMAVHIERIALILSAMRLEQGIKTATLQEQRLICTDIDYQIAEMIGNKLILHIAAAYRMIKGAEEVAVPKIQALDQRTMLLSLLPEEYESWTLINEAKTQGVPERTAFRWNEKWQEEGVVVKVRQGHFRKQLACA